MRFTERDFSHPDEAAPPRRVVRVVDDPLCSGFNLSPRGESCTQLLPRIVFAIRVFVVVD
jgi:hypothetical protein